MNALQVRSCLIDGEAVARDDNRLPDFEKLRSRTEDASVFLLAFELLEINGQDSAVIDRIYEFDAPLRPDARWL